MAKKSIKNFLFKLSAGQIITSILIVGVFIVFLVFLALSKASTGGGNTVLAIIMLTIMLLLSRLSVIVKVGIGFLSYILFPLQMVYGPMLPFIMIWVTTAIYCWIAVRPTPFDFVITKGLQSSIAQGVYLSLWSAAMMVLFFFMSTEYIMGHLVFVYMVSVFVYIVFMVICLPLLAMEPVPIVIVNGMMMFVFQYFLIVYTGKAFFGYVMALG